MLKPKLFELNIPRKQVLSISDYFYQLYCTNYLDTYAELKKKMRLDAESLLTYMVRFN